MLRVEKKRKFDLLVENATRCDLCERMRTRHKVLSHRNGDINAKVLFIGEAPGRLGADRTLVPFHGDRSGQNFERLLAAAGLKREEVFVTNAVICNPRDEKGNNTTPTQEEIRNCSLHLSLVLNILEPELVVTLGQRALAALGVIAPHSLRLRRDIRRPVKWTKYTVFPIYHPGPRATIHRSLSNQIADFYVIGEIFGRNQPRKVPHRRQRQLFPFFEPTLLHKVAFRII